MRETERLWHFSKWIDGQDMFLMLNCIALNYDEHIDVLMANLKKKQFFFQLPNMKWARKRAHHCTDDDNSIGEWKTCMFCWQTYQFAFRESESLRFFCAPWETSYVLKLITSRFFLLWDMVSHVYISIDEWTRAANVRARPAILILPINKIYVILILFDCCFPRE